MSPMQFFRKYSRVLVLVIMALLLVIFLLEPVLMRKSSSGDLRRVVGHAFARPVTVSDLTLAEIDLRAAASIAPGLLPPLRDRDEMGRVLSLYLLQQEAAELGLRVEASSVKELLDAQQFPAERLNQIASNLHRSIDGVYESLARIFSVHRLAQLQVEAAAAPSLPQMEQEYRRRMQQAVVRLSVIEGRAFLPQVAPPTEAELGAFFEECRGRAFDPSEERVLFGYKMDDQVLVEYLTVDPAKLSETTVSGREAKAYYDKYRNYYARSLPPDPVTSQPATPPEFEQLPADIQKRVRDDARQDKISEDAQRTVNAMRDAARAPWEAMDIGPDGFRRPPQPDKLPSFEDLKQRFSKDGVPVELGRTPLIEIIKLNSQESGIGRATTRISNRDVSLAELVRRSKGLYQPPTGEAQQEKSDLGVLNLGEPSNQIIALRAPNPRNPSERRVRQAFVFRVLQTIPAGPAPDIAPLKTKVESDWRLAKAYELAGAHARRLADRAKEIGLDAAVAEATELKAAILAGEAAGPATQPADTSIPTEPNVRFVERLGPFTPPGNFSRSTGFGLMWGDAAELPKRVFELADAPASQPAAHRIVLAPSADDVRWIVAEVQEFKPLYQGEFEARLPQLMNGNQRVAEQEVMTLWFNPEQIRSRTGYRAEGG